MAVQTPIPPNPIGENFAWRDWFQVLSDRVFGTASTLNVPIEPQYGGTGLTTYNAGDIIYSNVTNNLTRLAAPASTSLLQMTAAGVPSWTASSGIVTSVTGTSPVVSSGGATPAISMPAATTSVNGYLTSTDWTTFNGKGSGTVTSVAALTLGTTGTDLSSTVATGTSTPVITLQVPTASATNRGALSSTDWSTFNSKGSGTVTSVGWTGGIVSVGTATSTPAFTIAGTSGGIPYFNSATTWATSATLAANALVIGGGSGVAPSTTTTGTGVVTALGINTGSAGAVIVNGGVLGTPSSGTVTNLTGTASININGTVGATTPTTGKFTNITQSAGTTTVAPITLTSGTNLTTPVAGSWEYDGTAFYATPIASNRAVSVIEHFVARTGTKTMTSNTALQAIFSGGTGGLTNGALTVGASTSYFFEMSINVSAMSATSGNFGFSIVGAGTATFTSAAWHAFGLDNTNQQTGANAGTTWQSTAGATGNIVTAAVGTAASAIVKGIFRINGAGTIIPSIQLTTASAAVIGVDTWFKCYPVGTNTVISVGNWA